MSHEMPPAAHNYDPYNGADQQMGWGAPGSPAIDPANSLITYGNVAVPPRSISEMYAALPPTGGPIAEPDWLEAAKRSVAATASTRPTFAQMEVQSEIRGTETPVIPGNTVSTTWETTPSASRETAARVERLTGRDIAAFGGALVRAAFNGVQVAGHNFIRPDMKLVNEANRYGAKGALQMHALRSGLAGAKAYEAHIMNNPNARVAKVLARTEADMTNLQAELRRRRIEDSGGKPEDYGLAA